MAKVEVEGTHENHVLSVAFSAQGHINPMLRLGKRLVSKGIHFTLATTEVARHRILKFSTNSSNSETAVTVSDIDIVFFSDGFSLDYDRKANLDHYMDSFAKFGPVNLSSLIKARYHGHKRLLCLITNPFVPWAADVASEMGIPSALLWIQPCALYAIYYRFYNKLNQFPTLTDDPDLSVELPGLPLLSTQDLPSFVLPNNPFGSFPKIFSGMFQSLDKFKWVLGNSFYELEKGVIDEMVELCPILPVGPLVPSTLLGHDDEGQSDLGIDMWKSDDTCIEWLDTHPPNAVIYVSFGSIVVLPAREMECIANALKKSRRPFLWVVKPPEFPTPDGSGQLPLGFLEETKDQGLVVRWSPQTKVLVHPSIACFVTHCGWNSLLETICCGVPLIAFPQWTDQPTNAKLIVDVFNIGVRIAKDPSGTTIASEDVENCIDEIMVGPRAEEFRKNAGELKRAAHAAVPDGGSSDRNIQTLVDGIILENSSPNGRCVQKNKNEENVNMSGDGLQTISLSSSS